MVDDNKQKHRICVRLVSKELIKPSAPTPPHLRNYRISLLDQFGPPYYTPFVLLYPSPPPPAPYTTKYSQSFVLKKSLSLMLTRFYPLAGRLVKEENVVRCNDEGVEYSEAQVDLGGLTVSELTRKCGFMDDLGVLCPKTYTARADLPNQVLVAIQANFFGCGGVAIGFSVSHQIADGATAGNFIKCWASISLRHHRDDDDAIQIPDLYPILNAADVLPPKPPRPAPSRQEKLPKEDGLKKKAPEYTMRRFVFSGSTIAALKARGTSKNGIVPSRAQAVTALLWECLIAALRQQNEQEKENATITRSTATGTCTHEKGVSLMSLIVQTVNVRSKISPPLPDTLFGNIVKAAVAAWPVVGKYHNEKDDNNDDDRMLYQMLVKELRDSVATIDDGYARNRDLDGIGILGVPLHEPFTKIFLGPGEKLICSVSSCLRFPFYEIDFGWGNPVWVGTCKVPGQLVMLFNRSNDDDQVEALVCLEVETMNRFEENPHLPAFCSKTPISGNQGVTISGTTTRSRL